MVLPRALFVWRINPFPPGQVVSGGLEYLSRVRSWRAAPSCPNKLTTCKHLYALRASRGSAPELIKEISEMLMLLT